MKYENLNPISKWDDVGNNMLDEMRRESEAHYEEEKIHLYEEIVEEGLGSENVLDEWLFKEGLDVKAFIKMLYKREGRIFVRVKE